MSIHPKYIIILHGGIGNQLFQYAFAYYIREIKNGKAYTYYWDKYDMLCRSSIISEDNCQLEIPNNWIGWIDRLAIRYPRCIVTLAIKGIFRIWGVTFYGQGQNNDYTDYLKDIPGSGIWIYKGYWQSAEMVNKIKPQIGEMILKREIRDEKYIKIAKLIDSKQDSVCVHIRDFRQDEIKLSESLKTDFTHTQQTLGKNYYQRAIEKLSFLKDPFFFIFASDNELAHPMIQQVFPAGNYLLVPNAKGVAKDYETLLLMSRCKHFIMSNSTFGWWGAWLSWAQEKEREAIYFMPARWDKEDQDGKVSRSFVFSSNCQMIPDGEEL